MIYMLKCIKYGEGIEILQDDQQCLIVEQRILKFLDAWCRLYGSTYDGRKQACAQRMQIVQKIPILISERTRDILFPTKNVLAPDCIWLNYRGIDTYVRDGNQTVILFRNGQQIKLPLEYRAIKRELHICKEYLRILEDAPR